jgi:glycosyltransferase involved in cell wall biosynthesis
MRILNLLPSVDPAAGGAVEAVRQLQIPIEARGHKWDIVSLDAPDAPWLKDSPLHVRALGPALGFYSYSRSFSQQLSALLPNYDAAIVHGIWQYHAFGGWRALHRSSIPYGVYPHGMLDPYFKRNFPRKHLKKLLFWRWSEYRVLRDADAVLFTCEGEKILARESFRPYKAKERVVGLGTSPASEDADSAREAFLTRFPNLRGKRFLLYLARIHPKKGLDLLLEAFAKADIGPDVHLVIAGPDQTGWKKELEEKFVTPAMSDRITWTGMIEGDVKWGAFHAAESFVLPSHQENFGIAVAEALARGLPVLISNQVNIWREIEASGAGFVADDTLQGTQTLLSRWLELSQAERELMREKAARCFEEHFAIETAAQRLLECLEKVKK